MTIVFKTVAFSSAWRKREHRIKSIQRLDRGLFIDAKDSRVLRRIHVKTDDIGGLGLKVRVVRHHICSQADGVSDARCATPEPPSCDWYRRGPPTFGCSSASIRRLAVYELPPESWLAKPACASEPSVRDASNTVQQAWLEESVASSG